MHQLEQLFNMLLTAIVFVCSMPRCNSSVVINLVLIVGGER